MVQFHIFTLKIISHVRRILSAFISRSNDLIESLGLSRQSYEENTKFYIKKGFSREIIIKLVRRKKIKNKRGTHPYSSQDTNLGLWYSKWMRCQCNAEKNPRCLFTLPLNNESLQELDKNEDSQEFEWLDVLAIKDCFLWF